MRSDVWIVIVAVETAARDGRGVVAVVVYAIDTVAILIDIIPDGIVGTWVPRWILVVAIVAPAWLYRTAVTIFVPVTVVVAVPPPVVVVAPPPPPPLDPSDVSSPQDCVTSTTARSTNEKRRTCMGA